jgi:hypothetical protein
MLQQAAPVQCALSAQRFGGANGLPDVHYMQTMEDCKSLNRTIKERCWKWGAAGSCDATGMLQ